MPNNKYFILVTLLFIAINQIACKKDSCTLQTKTGLLTSGNWKLIASRTSNDNVTWHDQFPGFYDCWKDNILSFNSNFIYTQDEGNLKCDPSGSQIFRQGTWEFQLNETKLFMHDTIMREVFEIKQLDKKYLKTILRDTIGSDIIILEESYIH